MLVATTRKPSKDPGELFSGERGNAVTLNRFKISMPPDDRRHIGEVQWPSRAPPNPQREFAVVETEPVATVRGAHDWFRKSRTRHKQVLIFVHGFNNTYADAVFRFAQIVHDTGTDAAPVLFNWPSRGRMFDYMYDRESATYSRRALEDLILQVSASQDVQEVTILAHSMGCWLTVEALRGVAMRESSIPSKVKDVVLASPDLDVEVFRRQYLELGPQRPRFTIFSSTRDRALGFSSWIAGGVDRVGNSDLRPYTPLLRELGVSVIDATGATTGDTLGHNAFAESPEMVRLLAKRLSGQPLDGRRQGIGADAARFAGSAARVALAAPSAVLSTRMEELKKMLLAPGKNQMVDGRVFY